MRCIRTLIVKADASFCTLMALCSAGCEISQAQKLGLCLPMPAVLWQVAEGCSVLEQSLILLHSAGSPPLAPGLAANIQESLDSLKVQRILDQFTSNAEGPHAAA